ncbi:3(2),5-bisphosphate nucleotidase HAL2 [Leucogyrophana mollusca]|uniref:3(2),5-bisphosphate nucleotidase HAL2 n=1 Tax=Leucogyrophana mollusca TaxID=85980 RepID=A0ACB8BQS3_9AGAM|nr:3(2),5-bisphosphate nucleotidase HAL2 [Leucogyrophana mollusca]
MSTSFLTEKQVAISAVRRACLLTSSVFNKLVKNETLTKEDKSPVTVGDYAAQAVVNIILKRAFPDDPIVGEEDADDLKKDPALTKRVVELANEALQADLGLGEMAEWGIGPGPEKSAEELLGAIDQGNHVGGPLGRMWTLDPIDGTKGFLRGGQYAVCLALIIDGHVELGVIGCPNLPYDPSDPEGPRGCIFVAVRGQGAQQMTLSGANPAPVTIPEIAPGALNFLESVEAAHSDHSFNNRVSTSLNISRAPTRMDSQAKYCCLARGDGGVYLRMPTKAGYKEKIWDHASGNVLVEEAGGIVTDSRGLALNFGLGKTLGDNYGVIAARSDVHKKVLEAVQQARAAEEEEIAKAKA